MPFPYPRCKHLKVCAYFDLPQAPASSALSPLEALTHPPLRYSAAYWDFAYEIPVETPKRGNFGPALSVKIHNFYQALGEGHLKSLTLCTQLL